MVCRNPEVGRIPTGGHGANRGREAFGEDLVQHSRRWRGPRALSRLLSSKRPRSAGPGHPVHAEGPRYGIRLSGAVVVGPEGRAVLRAAAPSAASKRREGIATPSVHLVARRAVTAS